MSDRHPVGSTGIELPKVVFGTSALGNLYEELDVASKRHIVSSWFEEMEPPIAIDSAGKYGAGLASYTPVKVIPTRILTDSFQAK